MFGDGVAAEVSRGDSAGDRADVDHDASRLFQRGGGGGGHIQRGDDVGVDQRSKVIGGQRLDAASVGAADNVDQGVDAAEVVQRGGDDAVAVGGLNHVGGADLGAGEVVGQLTKPGGIAADHEDFVTAAVQGGGDDAAESGRAAG